MHGNIKPKLKIKVNVPKGNLSCIVVVTCAYKKKKKKSSLVF